MTPYQRKAIEILNRIKSEEHLNEDDYFFLMDFIVKDSQITYIPYIQNPDSIKANQHVIGNIVDWLKSIKDRVQPKQEWSKEDKERFISCLKRLGSGNPEQPETINSKWFKEHVFPQNTWKPNKEQLHLLHWIANIKLGDSVVEQEVSKHLNKLYEDLKKLKGE